MPTPATVTEIDRRPCEPCEATGLCQWCDQRPRDYCEPRSRHAARGRVVVAQLPTHQQQRVEELRRGKRTTAPVNGTRSDVDADELRRRAVQIADEQKRRVFGETCKHKRQRWVSEPAVQLAHRMLLDEAVATEHVYPESKFAGRGIVIPGGGARYFPCAWVAIRVLRELGCQLPVELWYMGPGEMDQTMLDLVAGMPGVTAVDALDFPRPRILAGWELKSFAIEHSRFEEVLLLDADNVPVLDPTYHFADDEYQRLGARFWPDLPNDKIWIPPLAYDTAGIERGTIRPLESGQLLINKRRTWHALQVARHLNDYSDYWYAPGLLYGDKDTFALGWHKAGQAYAIGPNSSWRRPAIQQRDAAGRIAFYHCCQGKEHLATGRRILALPEHIRRISQEAGHELNRKWSGKVHNLAESRSHFEDGCRASAVGIDLADDVTLTRVFGQQVLYCQTTENAFTPHLRGGGFWEAWISVALWRLVKPGWKCWDVGAHVGYFSMLMAARGAEVTAIEPNAKHADLIARSAKDNRFDIRTYNAAAWNSTGEVIPFWRHRKDAAYSSCVPQAGDDWHQVDVSTICIDDAELDRLDLVKIDAEGAECRIWQGMQHTLQRCNPRVVMEFSVAREYGSDFLSELAAYAPLRIINYDGNVENVTEDWLRGNPDGFQMLFIRRPEP